MTALLAVLLCCPAADLTVPVTAEVREPFTGLAVFSAAWCQPCRTMKPTVAKLQAEGLIIRIIDVDARPRAKRGWGVTTLPTTVAIHRDRPRNRHVGIASEQQLRTLYAEAVAP